jgi:hypothetical protein
MNTPLRRGAALAVALAVTLGIAALSRVPYAAADDDHALLRLSWRTPGQHIEECRRLSAEEIARQPVHMRREEICERRFLPYRLRVRLDERTVIDELVRPAGTREDRPLFVHRQLPLQPGSYRLEVAWESVALAATGHAATDRSATAPAVTTVPHRLGLDADLRLEAGYIALITYDLDQHVMVARGRGVVGGHGPHR